MKSCASTWSTVRSVHVTGGGNWRNLAKLRPPPRRRLHPPQAGRGLGQRTRLDRQMRYHGDKPALPPSTLQKEESSQGTADRSRWCRRYWWSSGAAQRTKMAARGSTHVARSKRKPPSSVGTRAHWKRTSMQPLSSSICAAVAPYAGCARRRGSGQGKRGRRAGYHRPVARENGEGETTTAFHPHLGDDAGRVDGETRRVAAARDVVHELLHPHAGIARRKAAPPYVTPWTSLNKHAPTPRPQPAHLTSSWSVKVTWRRSRNAADSCSAT